MLARDGLGLWGFRCLAICLALALGGRAAADNGELLQTCDLLSGVELVDITRDLSDGSFWVLGADGSRLANHSIYHISQDFTELLGILVNPHASGDIASNNLTTNRGIAYRPTSDTLLILSSTGPRLSQALEVREIQKDGTEVALAYFAVDVAGRSNVSLFGLTYDPTISLWSYDVENDEVVRISLGGTITETLIVPEKISSTTEIFGQGLAYEITPKGARIHLAHGDIFGRGPSRLLEIDTSPLMIDGVSYAARTGIETSLREIPDYDLRGIQTFNGPLSTKRLAVLGSGGLIYVIDRGISDPVPPSQLRCVLTLSNEVQLEWENNGKGVDQAYNGSLQVLRNDIPLSTIEGGDLAFLDSTPVRGQTTYSVRGSEASGSPFSDASCECRVTVGPGGLVDWSSFPGLSIYDIAEDPTTGDIFATDDRDDKIYQLDRQMNLLAVHESPIANPGGITFVPAIQVGFPPMTRENLLAIAEVGGTRVRLVPVETPAGPAVTTLTMNIGGDDPLIGGLTYVTDTQRFYVVDRNAIGSPQIVTLSSNGTQVAVCTPPFIGESIGRGITYDPLQDSFMTTFADGFVRELFPQGGCTSSAFAFELSSLGVAFADIDYIGGVQISDNTLLVAGTGANAVYRVLIFPFSPDFIRGDYNSDNQVNVTDAYGLASYLFVDGAEPQCKDAADVNDDGILDISDPVYLLFSLFMPDTPPPPEPFPTAGNDPTFRDNIGCGS